MRAPGEFFGFNWPDHENPIFLGKQHKSNTRQIQIITRQTQFNTRQKPPFVTVHASGLAHFPCVQMSDLRNHDSTQYWSDRGKCACFSSWLANLLTAFSDPLSRPQAVTILILEART